MCLFHKKLLNFVIYYSESKYIHGKIENFESNYIHRRFGKIEEMRKILLYHQNKEESILFFLPIF